MTFRSILPLAAVIVAGWGAYSLLSAPAGSAPTEPGWGAFECVAVAEDGSLLPLELTDKDDGMTMVTPSARIPLKRNAIMTTPQVHVATVASGGISVSVTIDSDGFMTSTATGDVPGGFMFIEGPCSAPR